jgi:hypothetical protein
MITTLLPGQITDLGTGLGISQQTSITGTNSSANFTQISYAVSSTTQELQKPSYDFLYSSFGLQLYLVIIGVLAFFLVSAYIESKKQGLGFDAKAAPIFIILFTYLLITSYLQYNAIRYNALVSIPIALFSAYGIYAVVRILWKPSNLSKSQATIATLIILAIATYIIYQAYLFIIQGLAGHSLLFTGAGALMILFGAALIIHTIYSLVKKNLKLKFLAITVVMVILIFGTAYSIAESYGSVQADGINPQFLSAMTWMKNNTPSNSLVLALWPDGSVVEGWANRTSYMDSVGGENGSRIYPFAQYLISNSADTGYLYSIGKPEYLLAREYFMSELTGLVTEGVPKNISAYSFVSLYPTSITHNNTSSFYQFANQYYNVTVVSSLVDNAPTYKGYVSSQSGPYALLGRVVLYNTSDDLYTTINASQPAANYTYIIFFSGNLISSGMLLTDTLYNTNLFKFVYLCNNMECPYNNRTQNITIQLVFSNNDSKIYKINYQ